MTLRLTLQSPHISIKAFPTVEIPDFTIITGRNGSGKSHLLDAIVQGRIFCDKNNVRVGINNSEIRSYSWANMVPQDPGMYSSDNSRNEKTQVLQQAKSLLQNNNLMLSVRQQAQQHGLNQFSDQELLRLKADEINSRSGTSSGTAFANSRDSLFHQNEQQIKNNNANFGPIIETAKSLGKSIFSISESELLNAGLPNYGRTDLFQQSFARLFVEYRDIFVRNELHELSHKKGRRETPALTEEQFNATHGAAPWDFVNTALNSMFYEE